MEPDNRARKGRTQTCQVRRLIQKSSIRTLRLIHNQVRCRQVSGGSVRSGGERFQPVVYDEEAHRSGISSGGRQDDGWVYGSDEAKCCRECSRRSHFCSGHWGSKNNQQRSYASCCRFCARFSVLISLTGAFSPAPRHQKITGNAESKAPTAQQYITNSYPSV